MGCIDGVICVQIDLLILNALSESFDEHVIPPAALAVHADLNPLVFQESRELLAGELTPLVGVEDLGAAILRDRLPHRIEAEVCGERIREPSGQHAATRPVQNGKQIHEASSHRNVGDIGCQDVIREGLINSGFQQTCAEKTGNLRKV